MDHLKMYRERLTDRRHAIRQIPSGAKIAFGIGIAQPPALLEAIAEAAGAGDIGDLAIYYMLSLADAGRTVLRSDLRHAIRPMSFFHGTIERELDRLALRNGTESVDIVPCAFSQVPNALTRHIGVDTLIATVAPMDDHGNFSFGTNADYIFRVGQTAKHVLLEVNREMPRTLGECAIHISRVTALIENHVPLIEVPLATAKPEDIAIGKIIAGLVDDGACLQMGIGAVPDCVCSALKGHRFMGIHTELLTPSLAGLIESGAIDQSRKTLHHGKGIFTFAMGNRKLYDLLDNNPALEAHPVDYVNSPAVIARNDNMVSVNATIEVDLSGACNSEMLDGRQYSGSGGQLDFVRGAYASKRGKSIIACHSTAAGGTRSRIVPRLSGAVTTPRNDTHIIVTEYGWVDLKGKSAKERAKALIAIAHPDFRESLEGSAYAWPALI